MADTLDSVAKGLAKLPDNLATELQATLSKIGEAIQSRAQSQHNFITRTGRLESSVTVGDYLNTGIDVYLDTGVAPYAPYVHAWDPFLDRAIESYQPQMDAAIDDAIEKALKGALG